MLHFIFLYVSMSEPQESFAFTTQPAQLIFFFSTTWKHCEYILLVRVSEWSFMFCCEERNEKRGVSQGYTFNVGGSNLSQSSLGFSLVCMLRALRRKKCNLAFLVLLPWLLCRFSFLDNNFYFCFSRCSYLFIGKDIGVYNFFWWGEN